jgi:spore coat polysaccharide biosynthesis protein SpsF
MTSTRLPGKVLLDLCGKSVLEHLTDRLGRSGYKPLVIVATTTNSQDDVLAEFAENHGLGIFRGSEEDVLGRYYHTTKKYGLDVIIRITSDCPLYEVSVLDKMLDDYVEGTSCDYLSNTIERTFPRGLDTEIFNFHTLERCHLEAVGRQLREHVTPYVYMNPDKFTIRQYKDSVDHSDLRWTLDTGEDFRLLSSIYALLYPSDHCFNYHQVLDAYSIKPQWREINSHVEQKKL